jgi:hypothetical protein
MNTKSSESESISSKEHFFAFIFICAAFFLIACFLDAASLKMQAVPVMEGPPDPESRRFLWNSMILDLGSVFFSSIAFIVLIYCIFRLIYPKGKDRIKILIVLTTCLLIIVKIFVFGKMFHKFWTESYERLAERAKPLVMAIENYHVENGKPPPTLQALVPEYIDAIPGTGMKGYPEFEYRDMASESVLMWWNMGRVEFGDSVEPNTEKFYYPVDCDHGNLIVVLHVNGSVSKILGNDLLLHRQKNSFEREMWSQVPEERMNMVDDILGNKELLNMTGDQLIEMLGDPDGKKQYNTSPWELRVDCGYLMSWDVFFYWPTKEYPDNIYGGVVQRIGEWAYVHE